MAIRSSWDHIGTLGVNPSPYPKLGFLACSDITAKMSSEDAIPANTTPEQFGALIKSEIQHWAVVIKATGAKAE